MYEPKILRHEADGSTTEMTLCRRMSATQEAVDQAVEVLVEMLDHRPDCAEQIALNMAITALQLVPLATGDGK